MVEYSPVTSYMQSVGSGSILLKSMVHLATKWRRVVNDVLVRSSECSFSMSAYLPSYLSDGKVQPLLSSGNRAGVCTYNNEYPIDLDGTRGVRLTRGALTLPDRYKVKIIEASLRSSNPAWICPRILARIIHTPSTPRPPEVMRQRYL